MYYELGLISVIVAGAYWSWFHLRRRPNGGVLFGSLLLLAVALCVLGMIGREIDNDVLAGAGAIGVGAGTCMLFVAPTLRGIAHRLAAREHYGLAGRVLDLAEVLAPGSGVADDKAQLGAMREIRDGRIDQAVDALTAVKARVHSGAGVLIDERITMMYLAAYRWEEGIAYADAHLWPVVAALPAAKPEEIAAAGRGQAPTVETPLALRRILGLSPPVWVELVGAYARTGDLNRAATMLARLEDACAGRADASEWIHRARLMFLALAGRVAAVEQLTGAGRARHMGVAARTYWRGVAHERHGETAAAAAAYERARDKARGKSRELVDQAIARLPTAPPATLGAKATEVIARVEAAPPPKLARWRRPTGPIATWGLTTAITTIALVIAAALGSSSEPGVLLRAGALAHTQIHAGEWWRLVSYMFVHIGVAHLALNAISLWVIGRICEQLLGSARTIAIFVIAGVAGGAISYVASEAPVSAGASGAVMGLLGAVLVELTLHKQRYRAAWRGGLWSLIAIVTVAQLGFGFLFPAIDQWAHGGGLAAGALLAAVLSPNARWGNLASHVASGLAAAAIAIAVLAGVQVARTSLVDSLTVRPTRAWDIGGVTFDAPAAWETNDGELVDQDIFLVLSVARYDTSAGLDKDLAAAVAGAPAQALQRNLAQVAPATERVVPLPPGWHGSELEASDADPLGDRVVYRVVVAARELRGKVVLVSLYAPDAIARDEPEILSDLLASAR